jgi:lactate dehydrogenase-like 2-hydroxyacid dehydrogenase
MVILGNVIVKHSKGYCMQKNQVFHLDRLPEDQKKMWQETAESIGFQFDCSNTDDQDGLKKQINAAEYLIVKKAVLAKELLDAAPDLKLVQLEGRLADKIPVEELKQRGIAFKVVGLPSTIAVAEHAVALILACAKKIVPAHDMTASGAYRDLGIQPKVTTERSHGFQWMKIEGLVELNGLKLGIFGFGEIGNEIAIRLRSFNMEILYHKRNRFDANYEQQLGINYASKEDLFKTADIIVLNCPLTPQTEKAVGEHELSLMKNTALLVNVSRGGVVDEPALVNALENKKIAGAGLDVFVEEPVPYDHPYLALDNVVLTPHIAGGLGAGRIRNINTVLGMIKESISQKK